MHYLHGSGSFWGFCYAVFYFMGSSIVLQDLTYIAIIDRLCYHLFHMRKKHLSFYMRYCLFLFLFPGGSFLCDIL